MDLTLTMIESPYAGDIERNLRYARRAMRDSLSRGEAPLASHLLYTQEGILDDSFSDERRLGIRSGFAWGHHARLIAVYTDLGISPGMQAAIDYYMRQGASIEYRSIGPEW